MKLVIFSSQSCSDDKDIFQKVWCTCKIVVLLIKPFVFLPFSLPVAVVVVKAPYFLSTKRESLFTFFASLEYAHHYLIKRIKWNLWKLKEHNNFSYIWKFEPDVPNSFGEIVFEKPPNLQKMFELISVLPLSSSAVFDCSCFLCYWLQRAETFSNCSN